MYIAKDDSLFAIVFLLVNRLESERYSKAAYKVVKSSSNLVMVHLQRLELWAH